MWRFAVPDRRPPDGGPDLLVSWATHRPPARAAIERGRAVGAEPAALNELNRRYVSTGWPLALARGEPQQHEARHRGLPDRRGDAEEGPRLRGARRPGHRSPRGSVHPSSDGSAVAF